MNSTKMERASAIANGIYCKDASDVYDKCMETRQYQGEIESLIDNLERLFPDLTNSRPSKLVSVSAIDYGCGEGSFTRQIMQRFSGRLSEVVGCDGSEFQIQKAREKLQLCGEDHRLKIRYEIADLTKDIDLVQENSEKFTYAFSLYVILHFTDYDAHLKRFFKQAFDSLRPSGHLMIQLTNFQFYRQIDPSHAVNNPEEFLEKVAQSERTKEPFKMVFCRSELGLTTEDYYWPDFVIVQALTETGFKQICMFIGLKKFAKIDRIQLGNERNCIDNVDEQNRFFLALK